MIEARGSRHGLVRAYDFYSRLYGLTAARLERAAVTRGLARAQVQPEERVLEVAVGAAAAHARLARRVGPRGLLVGVDLSMGMLKATRRKVPGARLARAEAARLPFADNCFDLVWASYLFDLISTAGMRPLLVEFRRVLRAGGRLLLVNFSKNGERLTWWERLYEWTPSWLVPWMWAGCRPVQVEAFVREAQFVEVSREFVQEGFPSEIITALKPQMCGE
jgi:ubiquinone/menaquinone biosynthesis C-methylase UbiE